MGLMPHAVHAVEHRRTAATPTPAPRRSHRRTAAGTVADRCRAWWPGLALLLAALCTTVIPATATAAAGNASATAGSGAATATEAPRAASPTLDPAATELAVRALQRAQDAVLGVQVLAVDDARSAATLGRSRQGSGVVIGADGLVLTIGYLILEADQVLLRPDDGRLVPARVVAYDVATGFGLVQALAPLRIEPVPLGRAEALGSDEPLMIASGGEDGAVSLARLVAQRPFSGYWEYHLDQALITAPARPDHSGAGLFNPRGELVGIGSLFLADTAAQPAVHAPPGGRQRGNLFVPVDLLTPILPELRRQGTTSASQRAWIGINGVERDGAVQVLRVNEDSPADVAGLQVGDRILRIDGTRVTALDVLWKALWSGGSAEREVALDIERDGQPQTLKVFTVDRMKTLRRSTGI